VCSELDSIPCPNSNSNYASWKSQTEKYTILDSASSGGLSCSLVIGTSGRIYHQSNLNFNQCIDPRYRLSIAQRIAQTFRDPDSKVICCSTSGCNWNEIFANSNTSPDQSSNLGTSDVVVSAVTGIILGFVVLIFCLFIFFIIFCRKEKEEDESQSRLYWKESTFERKQGSNNSTQNNSKLFEQRSNFNSPPIDERGEDRNRKAYLQSISEDDRQRNVYEERTRNVYDVNGYRRDQNNMYNNNPGAKKKLSKGKKPEWQNVYGKASQPADGAVNAFQWSD